MNSRARSAKHSKTHSVSAAVTCGAEQSNTGFNQSLEAKTPVCTNRYSPKRLNRFHTGPFSLTAGRELPTLTFVVSERIAIHKNLLGWHNASRCWLNREAVLAFSWLRMGSESDACMGARLNVVVAILLLPNTTLHNTAYRISFTHTARRREVRKYGQKPFKSAR